MVAEVVPVWICLGWRLQGKQDRQLLEKLCVLTDCDPEREGLQAGERE